MLGPTYKRDDFDDAQNPYSSQNLLTTTSICHRCA